MIVSYVTYQEDQHEPSRSGIISDFDPGNLLDSVSKILTIDYPEYPQHIENGKLFLIYNEEGNDEPFEITITDGNPYGDWHIYGTLISSYFINKDEIMHLNP